MKWIKRIIEVEDYVVVCSWNDEVIRKVDLTDFVHEKAQNPSNSYAPLLDKKRFSEVKCDGSTLYWEDGLQFEDYDGEVKQGPLDIAPELLYELTEEGHKVTSTNLS